jgi:hypothetical protein
MGWTSQHATHYRNGAIDRVAECLDLCTSQTETTVWKPLKASAVGRVVYVAVEKTTIEGERNVYAIVFVTSVNMKDYFNFSYKDIDETMGPLYYQCPNTILELLTPTTNTFATEWREKCYAYNTENKLSAKDPDSLSNLPIGSVIEIKYWDGNNVRLTKRKHSKPKTIWTDGTFRYTTSAIKQCGYKVISK